MAAGEVHIEKRTVFETAISMWTRLRRIKIQRWIVMSCKRLLYSLFATPLRRLILTWHFSWRYEEDALQKVARSRRSCCSGPSSQKARGRHRSCYCERLPPLPCGHEQGKDQGENNLRWRPLGTSLAS